MKPWKILQLHSVDEINFPLLRLNSHCANAMKFIYTVQIWMHYVVILMWKPLPVGKFQLSRQFSSRVQKGLLDIRTPYTNCNQVDRGHSNFLPQNFYGFIKKKKKKNVELRLQSIHLETFPNHLQIMCIIYVGKWIWKLSVLTIN